MKAFNDLISEIKGSGLICLDSGREFYRCELEFGDVIAVEEDIAAREVEHENTIAAKDVKIAHLQEQSEAEIARLNAVLGTLVKESESSLTLIGSDVTAKTIHEAKQLLK